MNIEKQCPFCGSISVVEDVCPDAIERWQNGMLIQDAFPSHTPDERELLLSGICTSCWDNNLGDG